MISLNGRFAIDRLTVPHFYTLIAEASRPQVVTVTVYAESGSHPNRCQIKVGHVSRQTPFGQGYYIEFSRADIREATPTEVRSALKRDHPRGAEFRPAFSELCSLGFSNPMMGATSRWTPERARSVLPVTPNEIKAYTEDLSRKYRQIIDQWDDLTQRQIKATLAELP